MRGLASLLRAAPRLQQNVGSAFERNVLSDVILARNVSVAVWSSSGACPQHAMQAAHVHTGAALGHQHLTGVRLASEKLGTC